MCNNSIMKLLLSTLLSTPVHSQSERSPLSSPIQSPTPLFSPVHTPTLDPLSSSPPSPSQGDENSSYQLSESDQESEMESQSASDSSIETLKPQRKTPKPVLCKHCKTPFCKSPSHTQFRGKKFCPKVERLTKTKWLAKRREEAGIEAYKYCGKSPARSNGHFRLLGHIYCPKKHKGVSIRKWREEVWNVCPPKPKPAPPPPPKKKQRKQSRCSSCNEVLKGHGTHFRGQWYCPNLPGQVPLEQWLTERQIEHRAKQAKR